MRDDHLHSSNNHFSLSSFPSFASYFSFASSSSSLSSSWCSSSLCAVCCVPCAVFCVRLELWQVDVWRVGVSPSGMRLSPHHTVCPQLRKPNSCVCSRLALLTLLWAFSFPLVFSLGFLPCAWPRLRSAFPSLGWLWWSGEPFHLGCGWHVHEKVLHEKQRSGEVSETRVRVWWQGHPWNVLCSLYLQSILTKRPRRELFPPGWLVNWTVVSGWIYWWSTHYTRQGSIWPGISSGSSTTTTTTTSTTTTEAKAMRFAE